MYIYNTYIYVSTPPTSYAIDVKNVICSKDITNVNAGEYETAKNSPLNGHQLYNL